MKVLQVYHFWCFSVCRWMNAFQGWGQCYSYWFIKTSKMKCIQWGSSACLQDCKFISPKKKPHMQSKVKSDCVSKHKQPPKIQTKQLFSPAGLHALWFLFIYFTTSDQNSPAVRETVWVLKCCAFKMPNTERPEKLKPFKGCSRSAVSNAVSCGVKRQAKHFT